MVWLRPLFRVLVVLCLVLSTQGLLLVQGTFLLRQDFVITNLCVNRAMPEMKCNGKCFLSKQLHEHREREQERNAASLELMLAACSLLVPSIDVADPPVRVRPYGTLPSPEVAAAFTGDIFHPPRG